MDTCAARIAGELTRHIFARCSAHDLAVLAGSCRACHRVAAGALAGVGCRQRDADGAWPWLPPGGRTVRRARWCAAARYCGFDVVRGVLRSRWNAIFNQAEGERCGADERFQSAGGEAWVELAEGKLCGVLSCAGLLECGSAGAKAVNTVRALKSTRGKRVQPLHGDAADDRTLGHLPTADVPLSVIWAIRPSTRLWVHSQGCGGAGINGDCAASW